MPTEDHQKDYLSLKELVTLIPYKAQTIYNWISAGVWQSG
jgi:predicted DNA-binding transcriptional regulator AlpA